MDAPVCPSFYLTREQLKATDFLSFVQRVFREQPDLPAFKIVPPTDWKPTQRRPNLDELTIQTPIKQLVRATHSRPLCARDAHLAAAARPTRVLVYRHLVRRAPTAVCSSKTRCGSGLCPLCPERARYPAGRLADQKQISQHVR
jgi:hypothetical protein